MLSRISRPVLFALTAFLLFLALPAKGQQGSPYHVTFFGSSVCFGAGAEENHGYAWQFFHSGAVDTMKFRYFNASTGGDNTLKVEKEDRIALKLMPTHPDIVVIGLSLANEGIMSPGDDNGREVILEQFRSRLLALADSLNSMGLHVVIVNCYAQSSFTPAHYNCTKRMNRIINTWPYPSINVLGTIDDLQGRWVEGYFRDAGHPNFAGHREMSYAIVPSLFEAIVEGKRIPAYDWHPGYSVLVNDYAEEYPIFMDIENSMHSFTLSFRFKKSRDGSIAGFISDEKHHHIDLRGPTLRYQGISVVYPENPDSWKHVLLSHSYAGGLTSLYLNGELVGSVEEQLTPVKIHFGGTAPYAELKDLTLHRAALNESEALDLYNKKMIQSSLEFYNPLTEENSGSFLKNQAQSFSELNIAGDVDLRLQQVDFY